MVAAAVGAAGVVAGLHSGGEERQPTGQSAPTEASTPRIGEEITVGPFAVTVNRFGCVPVEPLVPGTPLQRCDAALDVRNDGFGPQDFPASLQRAVQGLRRFAPRPSEATRIDPGAVVQVDIVFLLPRTLDPGRLEFRTSGRQTPVPVSVRA